MNEEEIIKNGQIGGRELAKPCWCRRIYLDQTWWCRECGRQSPSTECRPSIPSTTSSKHRHIRGHPGVSLRIFGVSGKRVDAYWTTKSFPFGLTTLGKAAEMAWWAAALFATKPSSPSKTLSLASSTFHSPLYRYKSSESSEPAGFCFTAALNVQRSSHPLVNCSRKGALLRVDGYTDKQLEVLHLKVNKLAVREGVNARE